MKRSRKAKKPEENVFNWRIVLVGLATFAVLSLFLYYVYGGRVTSVDYEGRIIDRWADYTQSTQGSQPYFRLLVESADGKRTTVRVDANTYESARVGMRIRSESGQIVLIESPKELIGK